MVKRCAFGLCNSDSRYPARNEGVIFYPFPKPKKNIDKCRRWIKACNRPHKQLNVDRITKNTYVCSKHFMNGCGPTPTYPDPIPLTSSTPKPSRPPPKNRGIFSKQSSESEKHEDPDNQCEESSQHVTATGVSTCSQTEEKWVEPMDVLLLAAENKNILEENRSLNGKLQTVYGAYDQLYKKTYTEKKNVKLQAELSQEFNVDVIIGDAKQFKYYTGLTPDQFLGVYIFLVPNDQVIPIQFPSNRSKEVMALNLKSQLFLTIMKLRHDFHYSDLAFRFKISKQTTSVIFTHWINYMFLRFGELSIWPHRNVIKENMPPKFKEEFPTTFGILDCTEIKINKPSSLKAQSQTYSDYKSCNTMKGLVVCDPRGSVTFASMLFSGGISDKDIFVRSKFEDMIKDLLDEGYLLQGDGLMADKGFNIEEEVEKCGLQLNIPPFATIGKQMTKSDALLTKKIAKHRVHVERAIERIKRFKILSGKFKLSLFTLINQIWYVCAMLSNFFLPCIKNKT